MVTLCKSGSSPPTPPLVGVRRRRAAEPHRKAQPERRQAVVAGGVEHPVTVAARHEALLRHQGNLEGDAEAGAGQRVPIARLGGDAPPQLGRTHILGSEKTRHFPAEN